MAPGDLGVVEPNGVRAVPAQSQGTGHELETFTLVGPLDHEQGGHEAISPRLGCEVTSESRSRLFSRLTPRTASVNPWEARLLRNLPSANAEAPVAVSCRLDAPAGS